MENTGGLSDMALCAVCCEEIKIPKILNCGHSFCLEPCLKELMKMQTFACPICKREIQQPTSGLADDFPTNYGLQSFVQCGAVPKRSLTIPLLSNEKRTEEKDSGRCSLHDNTITHFCDTCLEALCHGCVESSHDGSHDIVKHSEALQRGINDLQPILEEVSKLGAQLKDLSKAAQEAKGRYEAQANEIKQSIGEAKTMVHDLLEKKAKDLCKKVDVGKLVTLEKVKEIELKTTDLSLFSDYVKGISESLMADFTKEDLRRKGVIRGLVAKKEKLRHDIKKLQNETFRDKIGVSFISRKPTDIDFGNVDKGHVIADEKVVAHKQVSRVNAIELQEFTDPQWGYSSYVGHVWISLDMCIVIKKACSDDNNLTFEILNNTKRWFLPSVSTNKSFRLMSHVLGADGRSILINDPKTVHKVTFDIEHSKTNVQNKFLHNRLLHKIQAISWDENKIGCYVLLHDGITIKRFDFSKATHSEEEWEIKLRDAIKCSGLMHFHVSESGSMAIIDGESVKYFQTIQSHVTRTIKGPTTQRGWRPAFVTSRKVPQQWVVGWENNSNGFHRDTAIYQYSRDFELEHSVLSYQKTRDSIHTFSFVDEHHVALDIRCSNTNSFKISIFYLHQR
ncbi:uncharacterized protein [Apostichopus japonicus]|uniref:uncharacterized protein isoform X2 n=1 Tax=Stichopus japonicus TaxID=307972 RepID=UPI003AB8F48D